MNRQDALDLIKALRSGKYTQIINQLGIIQDGKEMNCCLGVLCRMKKVNRSIDTRSNVLYDNVCGGLTHHVASLVSMRALVGNLGSSELWESGNTVSLVGLNDGGFTFDEIADILYGFVVSDLIEEV